MATQIDTGTEQLLCTLEDRVATITLNNPSKRNALSNELTPALRRMLVELDANPEVRCLVLTGAGTAFCAGGDVSGMGANRDANSAVKPTTEQAIAALKAGQESVSLRLHEFSMPTIAALPGAAAGAGLSIALACDMRVMADSAFLVTAFANVGMSGDFGGSWFLTQLIGPARAKELYFSSRRVLASECLQLGLTNRIEAFDELAEKVQNFAAEIASGPSTAIRYMKQNLRRAQTEDLRTCLEWEAERMVLSAKTADHKEAVQAFMEKRKPDFA